MQWEAIVQMKQELNEQQIEIIKYLSQGLTVKQIAPEMCLSVHCIN